MANKPLKSIKFPGLSDTYTVPEVDSTLTGSGKAADAKAVGDQLGDLKSASTNNDKALSNGLIVNATFGGRTQTLTDEDAFDSKKEISGIWIGQDGIINNLNTCACTRVPVIPGAHYLFSYNASSPNLTRTSCGAWLGYDSDGNTTIIDIDHFENDTYLDNPAKHVIVPGNVVEIMLTTKLATSWDHRNSATMLWVSESGGFVNRVYGADVQDRRVDSVLTGYALQAEFENQTATYDTSENVYSNATIVSGYWIGADYTINANASSAYAKVPVIAGNTYAFSYQNAVPTFANTNTGGYLIYDTNNNVVSQIKAQDLRSGNDIDGYGTKLITIPENGAYFLFTAKLGTSWDRRSDVVMYNATFSGGNLVGLFGAEVGSKNDKWEGLKWVCVGDSLTEENLRTTKHYFDYVADKTGITTVNMGSSGTGYKRTEDENKAFYQRILNAPTDATVVTIFGSGNDCNYSAMGFNTFDEAIGSVTDTGTSTICGCINTTIDNLYSILPTVQLGIITPTPWSNSNPGDTDNNMTKYANAIVTICKNRGIPCLDLYHCSNMRPWDADYRELCYSKDDGGGTHPDETGHKIMSSHFMAFLETLISTY